MKLNFILSYIFPTYCLSCKKEGELICDVCRKKYIKLNKPSFVPPFNKSQKLKYLDNLFVVASYEKNFVLQKLLKKLKYYFASDVSKILGKLMREFLENNGLNISKYTLTSVPLHWKRKLWRGYNHSELLAREIGKNESLLKRVKNNPQQAKLKREDRLKNVKGAFVFTGKEVPSKVILVDDVCSTGATIEECAKILKEEGVREVVGVVMSGN